MSFENLMDQLEVLKKAQSEADDGDTKIADAAGIDQGDDVVGDVDDIDAAGDAGDVDAADDGGEPLAKSLSFKLEDGTEFEAIDGTELVKTLIARVENNESTIAKALGGAIDLIKSQGEMIKSLNEKVSRLSGEGRGRKTVVSIAEKPSLLKKSVDDEQPGLTPNEFMAKCLQAQAAGKITGQEVSRAEAYLNRGLDVPAEIVARVAAE